MLRYLLLGSFYCFLVLCYSTTPVHAISEKVSGNMVPVYDASITYAGRFQPHRVYYRHRSNLGWIRGVNGMFPSAVPCADARQTLESTGLWRGGLRPDGTCFKMDEPLDWATGNRLNFSVPVFDMQGNNGRASTL